MKNYLFLLLTNLSVSFIGFSQLDWQWMKSGGGTTNTNNYDMVYGLTKDGSNNIYSCGTFHGTNVSIGSSTYTASNRTVFVTKKDIDGNPIWTYVPTCTGISQAYNIAIDPSGNVIVCGQYSGSIMFSSTTLTAGAGTNSSYVCKLNGTTGSVIWAVALKSAGDATSDVSAVGLATHTDGTIYVCGSYKGTGLTFNMASSYGSTTNSSGVLQTDGFLDS